MRPLLFEQTVQSLLTNVTDISLVDHWMVVDDHTEPQYHERMKNALAAIPHNQQTWVWKQSAHTRGHAHSMNVLQERVALLKPTYVFHWEDDWQVIVRQPYVRLAIEALDRHPTWGQVLINQDYRETDSHVPTQQGELQSDGFYQHVYVPHTKEGYGSWYWPHYALRPSLMWAHIWTHVGRYNESHTHFELEYAERYFHKHGYQSGFFGGLNALHLGKKTWESEAQVASAYTLNGVNRF